MRLAHRLPFCLLVLASNLAIAQETLPEEVQFNRDVRPILSDNCFHCHGPDSAQRQADLRLDREEDIFANHDGLKILSPGKPAESELYRRIASSDEAERMPPVSPALSTADTAGPGRMEIAIAAAKKVSRVEGSVTLGSGDAPVPNSCAAGPARGRPP